MYWSTSLLLLTTTLLPTDVGGGDPSKGGAPGPALGSMGTPMGPPQGAQGPQRISAVLNGDFMLGALFSIHHQPKQKGNTLLCGKIREMYGIQRIEVTFHTLDIINRDPSILPNVTLGVEIRDSCWYAPIALQQSLEFIRDAISPPTPLTNQLTCHNAQQNGDLVQTDRRRAPLVGVIGPGSSSVALQVQNLLQLFQIPQIGYSTTSRDLSDKNRFNYFLRVVPSDYYQAQVMVDLVRTHNWTYVSAVNTDENYGQSGMQAFKELALRANVCIAKEDSVLSNADDEVFDSVLRKLNEDRNARVVVCFCEGMTVRGLLAATRRLNLTGRFLLLGSDGWADRSDVAEGFEAEARGSLSIRIHSPYVSAFDQYYFALNPFNNSRNPWFKEFWQDRFNCSIPANHPGPAANVTHDQQGLPVCTGKEKLSEKYKQDPKLSFVIKSIYTVAYGLHNLFKDVCGSNAQGPCPGLFPLNQSLFKNYLMNVSFTYGGDGETVEFDWRGDPPGRYNIMNFQQLANGSYDYIHVGDWNNGSLQLREALQLGHAPSGRVESVCSRPCNNGYRKVEDVRFAQGNVTEKQNSNAKDVVLHIVWAAELIFAVIVNKIERAIIGMYNIMNFQQLANGSYDYIHVGDWNNGSLQLREALQLGHAPSGRVESVCSRPCNNGYRKSLQSGGQEKKCCWVCVPCDRHEIIVDEFTCKPCALGYWPNINKTECAQIAVEFTKWTDTEALVSMGVSCLGFASTGLAAVVFIRHNNTPVVKSSTRELSYLILVGMALSHLATLPILAKPSAASCLLARLLPGLSFACIYASLLTKTNRIARILAGSKKRFPKRKPRFMSATAQVVITLILIGVEAVVLGCLLVVEPVGPALQYPSVERAVLECNSSPRAVLAPLAFDFLLVAMCTLYALKTRNVPENFNEAKFIGFAMYTTCVIWVAFLPIYFGSDSKVITMCMCVTLSAIVTLVFLFLPKLYIIVVRPERNNRAHFTTSKEIRCHIGTVAGAHSLTHSTVDTFTLAGCKDRAGLRKMNSSSMDRNCNNNHVPVARHTAILKTISVQTGAELVDALLDMTSRRKMAAAAVTTPRWAELSPRALLDPPKLGATKLGPPSRGGGGRVAPLIREESVSADEGEDDGSCCSGQYKSITIRLGGSTPSLVSITSLPM
ncbi:metabotropic glutamate receptor 1-like [Nilaparvata lugens]|uniref:metabotropic glutamate receptor 1-like n=1 Tax=Nilaparvata lugens TaxID=108931 RepID=UPI00193E0448|nr:metabotropic glutamate receptor 1-like [Nilaparvata lugens]